MKLIFLCGVVNHALMFRPVAEHLKEHGNAPIVLCMFRPEDYGMKDFPCDRNEDVQRQLASIMSSFREKYLDAPYLFRLPIILKMWRIARKFVKQQEGPIKLIIGSDYGFPEKVFLREVKRRRGKVVLVQDGFIGLKFPKFDILGQSTTGSAIRVLLRRSVTLFTNALGLGFLVVSRYGHAGADKIFVWGEYFRQVFLSQGIPDTKIQVTGKLGVILSNPPKQLKETLGIHASHPVITFFSTKYQSEHEQLGQRADIRLLARVLSETDLSAQLLLKIHPTHEQVSEYEEIIREFPNVKICRLENSLDLSRISNMVFSGISSAGFESFLVNPRVFFLFVKTPHRMLSTIHPRLLVKLNLIRTVQQLKSTLKSRISMSVVKESDEDSVRDIAFELFGDVQDRNLTSKFTVSLEEV